MLLVNKEYSAKDPIFMLYVTLQSWWRRCWTKESLLWIGQHKAPIWVLSKMLGVR